MIDTPHADEYPAKGPVADYLSLLPAGADVLMLLEHQQHELLALLQPLLAEPERAEYRYGPGKWSVKEVLGHLTDTERIFATRALAMARGETRPLPGFDENAYMAEAPFAHLSLFEVMQYYQSTRNANLLFFRTLRPEHLVLRGTAAGLSLTPRALVALVAGHERHHINILRERYGLL